MPFDLFYCVLGNDLNERQRFRHTRALKLCVFCQIDGPGSHSFIGWFRKDEIGLEGRHLNSRPFLRLHAEK